jgi:hypothetical protein
MIEKLFILSDEPLATSLRNTHLKRILIFLPGKNGTGDKNKIRLKI